MSFLSLRHDNDAVSRWRGRVAARLGVWRGFFAELARFKLWRWQLVELGEGEARVVYAGRRERQHDAAALFGVAAAAGRALSWRGAPRDVPWVVDAPLPRRARVLRVPSHLRCVLYFAPDYQTVWSAFDAELRRKIRRLSERGYRLETAGPDEIEALHEAMFVPYAAHRHGARVHQLDGAELRRLAGRGRVSKLMLGDRAIGAELGIAYFRGGQKLWASVRFGFLPEVFSDPKQLSDANVMNHYLNMRAAAEQGYAGYDMGLAEARPESGLLQFKRRRHATLHVPERAAPFSVWLPPDAAMWLERAPLFDAEGGLALNQSVTLNLGATGSPDALAVRRLKNLRFAGVRRVRLWPRAPWDAAAWQQLVSEALAVPVEIEAEDVPAAPARLAFSGTELAAPPR